MAEKVRFELTEGYQPPTVFKTVSLNHSDTFPRNTLLVAGGVTATPDIRLMRPTRHFFSIPAILELPIGIEPTTP